MNRTMTLVDSDIAAGTLQVEAAKRRIVEINPRANVEAYPCRWQDRPKDLQTCDLIVGCVDSFSERQQLEAFCRRHLICYIDIGMDVVQGKEGPPAMSGQVIVSMPGGRCMFCAGFLTEEKLGREANNYGGAGGRPQVVWANGVLATTALGLAVEILTHWTQAPRGPIFLSYRGNDGTLPRTCACPTSPRSVRTIRRTRPATRCSRSCSRKTRARLEHTEALTSAPAAVRLSIPRKTGPSDLNFPGLLAPRPLKSTRCRLAKSWRKPSPREPNATAM
jgi:hypothetical protein